MTSLDPVGRGFASTPNQGDLNTGTGVGVAVAQPSSYQQTANTDTAEPFETLKNEKLQAMIKDIGLKSSLGTEGAVLAMEKLDARQRKLQDKLDAGENRATSSLQSLNAMRLQ